MPRTRKRDLDEPVHTITQVAAILGCSRSHVERLIASGALEALDVGNGEKRATWRIPERSVRLFLDRRALDPT